MFKNVTKKQLIVTLILIVIAILATILFEFLYLANVIKFDPSYITTLFGVVYLLNGWMFPKHEEFKHRKSTGNYNGELPDDVKNKKFKYRFPMILSALVTLILSVIWFYI